MLSCNAETVRLWNQFQVLVWDLRWHIFLVCRKVGDVLTEFESVPTPHLHLAYMWPSLTIWKCGPSCFSLLACREVSMWSLPFDPSQSRQTMPNEAESEIDQSTHPTSKQNFRKSGEILFGENDVGRLHVPSRCMSRCLALDVLRATFLHWQPFTWTKHNDTADIKSETKRHQKFTLKVHVIIKWIMIMILHMIFTCSCSILTYHIFCIYIYIRYPPPKRKSLPFSWAKGVSYIHIYKYTSLVIKKTVL